MAAWAARLAARRPRDRRRTRAVGITQPAVARLPDALLPLRQEQQKLGTAAGSLLVRTTHEAIERWIVEREDAA